MSRDASTDGFLCGWSRLTSWADPVVLELLADDQPVLAVRAEQFRQDRLDAGYGAGWHGFRVDQGALNLPPGAVIRIRVAAHGMELENSGRRSATSRVLA